LEVIKGIAAYFKLLIPSKQRFATADEGKVDKYKYIFIGPRVVTLQITKFSDVVGTIIPFFDKYPIQGKKALDFEDFKKVSKIMENDTPASRLTVEGLNKILKIKERMNKFR
jgi:hypothetical protein